MKVFLILAVFVAASMTAPNVAKVSSMMELPEIKILKKQIPIIRYLLNSDNRGSFNLESVSGDGSSSQKEGHLKDLGDPEGPVTVMSGTFSYAGDDGKTYTVNWGADEEGFKVSAAHLPTTPPPIPEEIKKTL